MTIKIGFIIIFVCWASTLASKSNDRLVAPNYSVHAQWKMQHLSVDEGLSNNYVKSITQDKYGYIWIATVFGLNRFDGLRTQYYFYNDEDVNSLNSNYISALYCDADSNLWIGTDKGLHQYDYLKQEFIRVTLKDSLNKEVFAIAQGEDKRLWVGTSSGLFFKKDSKADWEKLSLINKGLPNDSIYRVLVDRKSNLWISTYQTGLYFYNKESGKVTSFRRKPNNPSSLADDWVHCLYLDKDDDLWVGTYNSGFCRLNKTDSTFVNYILDPNQEFTKRVRTIFEDKNGRLFLGSRQGLFLFDKDEERAYLYGLNTHPVTQLSQNSITYSFCDNNQNIWLGTHSGGVSYANMYAKQIIHYKSIPGDSRFLNTGAVHCFEELGNYLLVGTEKGVNVLNKKSNDFSYLKNTPNDPSSISYNDVKQIAVSSPDSIWIATNKGGLDLVGSDFKVKRHFVHNHLDTSSLPTNNLYNVHVDRYQNIWVVGNKDWDRRKCILSRYDKGSDTFLHYEEDFFMGVYDFHDRNMYVGGVYGFYRYDKKNDRFEAFVDSNLIYRTDVLYMDDKGDMWVGNYKGLAKYDFKKGEFVDISKELKFGTKEVYGILGKGNTLWISSNSGLIRLLDIYSSQIKSRIYNQGDGLQSREFNYNAYYEDSKGYYYFGGDNGFNKFHPDSIKDNPYAPHVYLTSLQIGEDEVLPNQKVNGKIILSKSIAETSGIELGNQVEDFTLRFDVLHYANAKANSYKYKIRQSDKWTFVNASHNYINFRNLKEGDYHLVIYGISSDGVESKTPIQLEIKIKPAFYQRNSFFVLLLVFVALVVIAAFRIRTNQLKAQKHKLEQLVKEKTKKLEWSNKELQDQKEEIIQQRDTIAEKTRELEEHTKTLQKKVYERTIDLEDAKERAEQSNRLKTAFLENMSHEVRTPLNAIIGFINIIDADRDNKEVWEFFDYIRSSGDSLMKIIEDIIDFSKIKSGTLDVFLEKMQLDAAIDDLMYVYSKDLLKHNKMYHQDVTMKIENLHSPVGLEIISDIYRFKQLFGNLISNAIKFTHEGEVTFGLYSLENGIYTFYVKDTGIGIDSDSYQDIFQSFRKLEDRSDNLYRGNGLGLSIAKYLAESMEGRIWLESVSGEGTNFFFSIKSSKQTTESVYIKNKEDAAAFQLPIWEDKTVLIVEDEEVNFEFLSAVLKKTKANILHASDGQQAVSMYQQNKERIDIILMDIKLPVMTGYEASEKIKSINSDIPIIAQTAYVFSADLDKYKGVIIDDFIAKPIFKEELLVKMDKWMKVNVQ